MSESKTLGNLNEITSFIHCALCITEVLASRHTGQPASPAEYQRLQVGWTTLGLQIWCRRHDVNVMHIDFEGHKHPANSRRAAP